MDLIDIAQNILSGPMGAKQGEGSIDCNRHSRVNIAQARIRGRELHARPAMMVAKGAGTEW